MRRIIPVEAQSVYLTYIGNYYILMLIKNILYMDYILARETFEKLCRKIHGRSDEFCFQTEPAVGAWCFFPVRISDQGIKNMSQQTSVPIMALTSPAEKVQVQRTFFAVSSKHTIVELYQRNPPAGSEPVLITKIRWEILGEWLIFIRERPHNSARPTFEVTLCKSTDILKITFDDHLRDTAASN
jgi:hypothetical protein